MLSIKNIDVEVDGKRVLNDFSLNINDGSINIIMGPNGVGKSTLSRVIMGDNHYKVINGDILYNGESIKDLTPDVRSRKGIFLAMQYPMEIDGVSNQDFLRTAMSSHGGKKVGLYDFILKCEKASDELKMDKSLIHRSLNVGFSGGEKKKNEVLQMKLLKPSFIILDELDSGLDVDSVKIVAENVKKYKEENPNTSILIITHLPKLVDYLKPDYVHIVINGKIYESGGYELAMNIFENGYEKYLSMTNDIDKDLNNE